MIFIILLENDVEKIDILFHKYSSQLLYYIRTIIKDERLAEDTLQETFVQIIKNIDKIDDTETIRTKNYLYTIAKNEAFQLYNKNKKQNDVTIPYDENIIIMIDESQARENIAKAEIGEKLEECIEEMSAEDKEVIALKYGMELDDDQIAIILHITQEAVRQRLSRARRRLAVIIENKRKDN